MKLVSGFWLILGLARAKDENNLLIDINELEKPDLDLGKSYLKFLMKKNINLVKPELKILILLNDE